jgi:hypothetical protein
MFALYSLPPSKRQKSRKVDRDLCTKTKETGFFAVFAGCNTSFRPSNPVSDQSWMHFDAST